MSRKKMEEYLKKHQNQYIGKYHYQSHILINQSTYKFKYYILDAQFREIDVSVTVQHEPSIQYMFSVLLHDHEQNFIVCDALERMLYFMRFTMALDVKCYGDYMNIKRNDLFLTPLDYRHLLDYLEFHQGINQEVVDTFCELFIPYLEGLRNAKKYEQFMDACNLLLDKILYEYEWVGETSKYFDTQYQLYITYFHTMIQIVYKKLDLFYDTCFESLTEAITHICKVPIFAFALYTTLPSIQIERPKCRFLLMEHIYASLKDNIVATYFYTKVKKLEEEYQNASINIIRLIMNHMLTIANYGLQKQIGDAIIAAQGYDLLIQLFSQDFNTFLFVCFPISSFPEKYREIVKEELQKAVFFYVGRMEDDRYRLPSFEQVSNINRLLMENYKEYR